MIDWTKPVQTRDGCKVRVLCTDADCKDYPVIALVAYGGRDTVVSYHTNGSSCMGQTSAVDAINVPEQTRRWVNIYGDGKTFLWPTRDLADEFRGNNCLGVIELVFEDGRIVSCDFKNITKENCDAILGPESSSELKSTS